MAPKRSPRGEGAFAAAAAPGLGRAPRTHVRAALGQVADLLGRSVGAGAAGGPGATVAHLGARTGVLTGQLRRAGVPLLAVEADGTARAQLRRALPELRVVAAVDGALPFAAGSLHGLLVSDGSALGRAEVVAEAARVAVGGSPMVLVADRTGLATPGEWPELPGWSPPEATLHHESPRPDGSHLATEVVVWRLDP